MLRQIKYFQSVVRNNSFSEVAEECHISQSAISQQIQVLERELGFQLLELKAEGRFRHFGISFHDTPEVLEQILTEYPQIEVVQIQFNYVDYDDPAVQSRKVYEVCRKYNKPVIVLEPVKGCSLVNRESAGGCKSNSERTSRRESCQLCDPFCGWL